jgi:NADP-dependent 3-hydroxy acid dehydrogenase YdfG
MSLAAPQPRSNSEPLLDGRVAVVTGAASGIGAAIARRLAAEGARVTLLARRQGRLDDVAAQIERAGGSALARAADVTDAGRLAAVANEVAAQFGTVDLLVNTAGVMLPGPIGDQPVAEWQRMIDTNLVGPLNAIRTFVPALTHAASKSGRADLVNVSSIAAKTVFPTYAVYGATKAALTQLSAGLRAELAPQDVRVTDLQPGLTDTELATHITDQDAREGLQAMLEVIPALHADDIADLICFVVSRPPRVNLPTLDMVPTRQA